MDVASSEPAFEARHATLKAIGSGQTPALKHVDMDDRSSPMIEDGVQLKTWDKGGFLHEVEAGTSLKHVTTDDRSAPVIEAVQLQPSKHKEVLTEVKAAAVHRETVQLIKSMSGSAPPLQHVEVVDKSQPAIPADVKINKWDKEGFLQELKSTHSLKHVEPEEQHDRSQPVIDPSVQVVQDHKHERLMAEIEKKASSPRHGLHHIDASSVHDASAPVIPQRSPTLKVQPSVS